MNDTTQEFQFKQLDKFAMNTRAPGDSGKNSFLKWSSYRGNPRISVFTQVANDTNKGFIHAAMNPETFIVFLNLFENMIKENKEDKMKMDCFTLTKSNSDSIKREKIFSSALWFGKDANGIVWLSVVAENRPKIRFNFKISDFHQFYKNDGQQLTLSEASCLQAMACVQALRAAFYTHMMDLTPHYEGKNNESSSAKSQKPAVEFEDLNF